MFIQSRSSRLTSLLLVTLYTGGWAARHTSPSFSQPPLAQKIHVSGISDVGKVNEFLYRGAQDSPWVRRLDFSWVRGLDYFGMAWTPSFACCR
jgi:hypothetical protein